jgi:amidohydrolase
MSDLVSEAEALFEYTRSLRRDFHAHPELGFHENRTSGIVAKELAGLGLNIQTGIGGTGVVATIKGAKSGPVILARADMDALPITEESDAPYASQNPGIMHACGHDGHTAMLLTAAKLLHEHRDDLTGMVKLMFQPAEEGMGGAEKMIEDGVLENPKVDMALALHVWNEKPIGWIGISNGPALAGAEIFKIRIIGKGGHAAIPNLVIDPILAATQVVSALQTIVSRNVAPKQTAVVSVSTIHGGDAFNVIPPAVELSGTIRTFEPEVRTLVLERFKKIVSSTAEAMGCLAEIDIQRLTPSVINQPDIAAHIQMVARHLLPAAEVDPASYITMGSDDFAFVLEKTRGCFFFIGSANPEKGIGASHHHPKFDMDEAVLPTGAALMAASVIDLMR